MGGSTVAIVRTIGSVCLGDDVENVGTLSQRDDLQRVSSRSPSNAEAHPRTMAGTDAPSATTSPTPRRRPDMVDRSPTTRRAPARPRRAPRTSRDDTRSIDDRRAERDELRRYARSQLGMR